MSSEDFDEDDNVEEEKSLTLSDRSGIKSSEVSFRA